jgi:hypothetical protein
MVLQRRAHSYLQVEESSGIGPYEEDEHADHGSVADQREEMVLRHLEQEPRRRRRRDNGRRHRLVPPQHDVRRCIRQSRKQDLSGMQPLRPMMQTSELYIW